MTESVTLIIKRCRGCSEVKPASAYHLMKSAKDGLYPYCKPCNRERVRLSTQRRRERMGEEAWLESQRKSVEKSRIKRGSVNEREYAKAKNKAFTTLASRHQKEFDFLFTLAKRGELEEWSEAQ